MLSEACQALPPVETHKYSPKGVYETVGGLQTYVAGSQSSKKCVIDIFDAFGIRPQTLQGADMLSAGLGALVLMPNFFKGEGADPAAFPPDTPEKQKILKDFMTAHGDFDKNLADLLDFTEAAKEKWPGVVNWGVFGLCWGGKVAALASAEGTPFQVSGQGHGGRMVKGDAEKMVIPHICLASPREPADVVKEYQEILGKKEPPGEVETYTTMFHGWMGAMADFENVENVKEFERAYPDCLSFRALSSAKADMRCRYSQVANFFAKHL